MRQTGQRSGKTVACCLAVRRKCRPASPLAPLSALDSRYDNTLNEVALRKKEYPDWNQSGNDRHGHQELDIDLGAANEAVQSQGDREQFGRVEIDQWSEKLIPGPKAPIDLPPWIWNSSCRKGLPGFKGISGPVLRVERALFLFQFVLPGVGSIGGIQHGRQHRPDRTNAAGQSVSLLSLECDYEFYYGGSGWANTFRRPGADAAGGQRADPVRFQGATGPSRRETTQERMIAPILMRDLAGRGAGHCWGIGGSTSDSEKASSTF